MATSAIVTQDEKIVITRSQSGRSWSLLRVRIVKIALTDFGPNFGMFRIRDEAAMAGKNRLEINQHWGPRAARLQIMQ